MGGKEWHGETYCAVCPRVVERLCHTVVDRGFGNEGRVVVFINESDAWR